MDIHNDQSLNRKNYIDCYFFLYYFYKNNKPIFGKENLWFNPDTIIFPFTYMIADLDPVLTLLCTFIFVF